MPEYTAVFISPETDPRLAPLAFDVVQSESVSNLLGLSHNRVRAGGVASVLGPSGEWIYVVPQPQIAQPRDESPQNLTDRVKA